MVKFILITQILSLKKALEWKSDIHDSEGIGNANYLEKCRFSLIFRLFVVGYENRLEKVLSVLQHILINYLKIAWGLKSSLIIEIFRF